MTFLKKIQFFSDFRSRDADGHHPYISPGPMKVMQVFTSALQVPKSLVQPVVPFQPVCKATEEAVGGRRAAIVKKCSGCPRVLTETPKSQNFGPDGPFFGVQRRQDAILWGARVLLTKLDILSYSIKLVRGDRTESPRRRRRCDNAQAKARAKSKAMRKAKAQAKAIAAAATGATSVESARGRHEE